MLLDIALNSKTCERDIHLCFICLDYRSTDLSADQNLKRIASLLFSCFIVVNRGRKIVIPIPSIMARAESGVSKLSFFLSQQMIECLGRHKLFDDWTISSNHKNMNLSSSFLVQALCYMLYIHFLI